MKIARDLALLTSIMMAASAATAADDSLPSLSVTGYGTLGIARTSTDDGQLVYDGRPPNGAGKSWNAGVDSRFGLQLSSQITQSFSATGRSQESSATRF